MIWRCPRCRGELAEIGEGVACQVCGVSYQSFGGIPDLRLPGVSWIDYEEDRAQAHQLIAESSRLTAAELVRYVFEWRKEMSVAWREKRTRRVMQARNRRATDIEGWLRPCFSPDASCLEIGCGSGQLLAAAAAAGYRGIGIDVRLVWLLVAKRMIADAGGTPVLAAPMAKKLCQIP